MGLISFLNEQPTTINDPWEPYLKHGKRVFIKNKNTIFKQGDQGTGIYYIYKGLIKIITHAPDGTERILDIKGQYHLIGEQAIDNQNYFSTSVALEDSILYYFPNNQFKQLLQTSPDFLTIFANSIVDKIRLLADDIVLSNYGAEQKIAFTLLKVKDACRKDLISLSQQDIASFTGLTRITVYKTLKKWKEENLIHVMGKTIQIINQERFKSLLSLNLQGLTATNAR